MPRTCPTCHSSRFLYMIASKTNDLFHCPDCGTAELIAKGDINRRIQLYVPSGKVKTGPAPHYFVIELPGSPGGKSFFNKFFSREEALAHVNAANPEGIFVVVEGRKLDLVEKKTYGFAKP